MGKEREPKPAKLFMSLIASEDEILQQGIQDLSLTYGEFDFISERLFLQFH